MSRCAVRSPARGARIRHGRQDRIRPLRRRQPRRDSGRDAESALRARAGAGPDHRHLGRGPERGLHRLPARDRGDGRRACRCLARARPMAGLPARSADRLPGLLRVQGPPGPGGEPASARRRADRVRSARGRGDSLPRHRDRRAQRIRAATVERAGAGRGARQRRPSRRLPADALGGPGPDRRRRRQQHADLARDRARCRDRLHPPDRDCL